MSAQIKNPYKIQSSGDPRVKRIVDADENIIAFVMAMANGTWRLFDLNEEPLSWTSYASPAKACTGYHRGNYKIVRDTIGPHVGQWIVEDEDGRIIEGPFDTKRDAEEYLVSRENWRQFYAGS